jgi:hypothetical protein
MTKEKFWNMAKGAAIGVVGAIIVFTGWYTPWGARDRMAQAVRGVLSIACADQFIAHDDWVADLKNASSFMRSDVVRKNIPKIGGEDVNYQLSSACADLIGKRLTTAAK